MLFALPVFLNNLYYKFKFILEELENYSIVIIKGRTFLTFLFTSSQNGSNMKIKYLFYILFLLSFIIAGCSPPDDTTENNTNNINNDPPDFMEYPATLIQVIDGDTVLVRYNDEQIKIRFNCINTPETYPVEEPWGPEAKQFTISHLVVNSWIGLEFDDPNCASTTPPAECFGDYDRLLAYIRTPNDEDLGALLTYNGLADVYTNSTCSRKSAYLQYLYDAQAANRGMWSK
jgi:endonuclease YncB( thermonuclease family)